MFWTAQTRLKCEGILNLYATKYGYRLTVRNNGMNNDRQYFEIQFLDADGYVIDTKTERAVIKPGATEIITGETLVNLPGAARVAKLKAIWKS